MLSPSLQGTTPCFQEKNNFLPNGNSLCLDYEEFDPVVTDNKNSSWKALVRSKSLV